MLVFFSLSLLHSHFGSFYRSRRTEMGNIAPSVSFSFKVNFSRETPNDFYLSGDRVQGVIQVATDDTDNDLNSKYGPLYVELIGELNDFKASIQQHINRGVKIFFRKRAQLTKLPNDNQQLVRYSFKESLLFGKKNIYYCFYFFPYEFKVILFE